MSPASVRFALTQEFAAFAQFDANDVSDIDRIFDWLGNTEGIAELSRFSKGMPVPMRRDIAVALVVHDQLEYEPLAISLLIDASALAWKRANSGSRSWRTWNRASLPFLRQVASEPVMTNHLKSLHVWHSRFLSASNVE